MNTFSTLMGDDIPRLMQKIAQEIVMQDPVHCPDWPQGDRRGIPCTIHIHNPYELLMRKMPKLTSASPETLDEYTREIIQGTADKARADIECYTYHDRMCSPVNQIDRCEEELIRNPNSNRAVITLGRPNDIDLGDMPCLRQIQFKICRNKLRMSTIWRSRDFAEAWYMNVYAFIWFGQVFADRLGIDFKNYIEYNEDLHVYQNSFQKTLKFSRIDFPGIPFEAFEDGEDE